MKQLLVSLIFSLFFIFSLAAQETLSKWDFRFGFGSSSFQRESIGTLVIENEINYHFNSYLSTSFALTYGKRKKERLFEFEDIKSYRGSFRSLWQSNLTLFITPFQNTARMNFRIGAGLSHYSLIDSTISEWSDSPNEVEASFRANQRKGFGGNFSLEYTYTTKKQWLLGAKYAIQPYKNGVVHEAFLLKIGRRLQRKS